MTTPCIRMELTGMDACLSLFGPNGRNLPMMESELSVQLSLRGNELTITGDEENAAMAAQVVEKLTDLHNRKALIDRTTLRYALGLVKEGRLDQLDDIAFEVVAVTHRGRPIRCKTLGKIGGIRF